MVTPKNVDDQRPAHRRIKSIEVGFRILRVLEQAHGKLPLRDIAASAGMPASNAHLYLASFIHEGMAEQDPVTGHYGLGPLAVQLGASALKQSSLIELANDLLISLREATRDSVFLSIWGSRGPTIVFKIDGDACGPMGIRVGHVLPLLSTATGRVFLSYVPESRTKALVAHERQASRSLAGGFDERVRDLVVPEIVASVRGTRFARTDAKMSGGFPASAAPVFDQSGRLATVITILGPNVGATDPSDEGGVDAKLLHSARELSGRLGGSDYWD